LNGVTRAVPQPLITSGARFKFAIIPLLSISILE
jgi:hypothetical protein